MYCVKKSQEGEEWKEKSLSLFGVQCDSKNSSFVEQYKYNFHCYNRSGLIC